MNRAMFIYVFWTSIWLHERFAHRPIAFNRINLELIRWAALFDFNTLGSKVPGSVGKVETSSVVQTFSKWQLGPTFICQPTAKCNIRGKWTARRITTATCATTTSAITTIMAMATMSQLKCQTKGDDGNGIDSYGCGGGGTKHNETKSKRCAQ